jgi:hypothetical protein
MKKKISILFILTLSFGICFAIILSMRSVLVHSTPLTNDTITNNNNDIPAIQKNSNTTTITPKGLDVSSYTTASSKKSNSTFFIRGSIASLLINNKESTPSEIASVNGSNAIYNATITNASHGSPVNNGIVNRVEGNHTKTYNNNSTSPSESESIVNSNIFSRTLNSYNSTSVSQNLDDSMINLLTKLIMGSMISGSSPTSKYPESITQAASTTQTETEKPFILTGDWNLSVKNGKARDFTANFTMLHIDGTGSHVIKLINFQADANRTVYLGSDGTASIIGTVDVELNGTDKWKGVHTIIVIERLNTIYVVLDSNATANYFKGQPIYGITELLKEDKNGNRLL